MWTTRAYDTVVSCVSMICIPKFLRCILLLYFEIKQSGISIFGLFSLWLHEWKHLFVVNHAIAAHNAACVFYSSPHKKVSFINSACLTGKTLSRTTLAACMWSYIFFLLQPHTLTGCLAGWCRSVPLDSTFEWACKSPNRTTIQTQCVGSVNELGFHIIACIFQSLSLSISFKSSHTAASYLPAYLSIVPTFHTCARSIDRRWRRRWAAENSFFVDEVAVAHR